MALKQPSLVHANGFLPRVRRRSRRTGEAMRARTPSRSLADRGLCHRRRALPARQDAHAVRRRAGARLSSASCGRPAGSAGLQPAERDDLHPGGGRPRRRRRPHPDRSGARPSVFRIHPEPAGLSRAAAGASRSTRVPASPPNMAVDFGRSSVSVRAVSRPICRRRSPISPARAPNGSALSSARCGRGDGC